MKEPKVQPRRLDLGHLHEGATIEGIFRVRSASEFKSIEVSYDPAGNENLFEIINPMSDRQWVHLIPFRLSCKRPGKWEIRVKIDTGEQTVVLRISAGISADNPRRKRILFCGTPYHQHVTEFELENLRLIIREFNVGFDALFLLPNELSSYQLIVLNPQGLQKLKEADWSSIDSYLSKDGVLLVMANHFMQSSVSLANRLLTKYGITYADKEYGEIVCGDTHFAKSSSIVNEVRRLRFFRPSPLLLSGTAHSVVANPLDLSESLIATGGPKSNIVAIGQSLLYDLVGYTWPFDNGKLFANIAMFAQGFDVSSA